MLKKNQRYFNWINRLLDMGIVFMSYYAAIILWFFILEHDRSNIAVRIAREQQMLLLIISFAYMVVFQYTGMYDSLRFSSLWKELVRLFQLFALCTGVVIGAIFILKVRDFSRGAIGSYCIIAYAALCAKRIVLRIFLRIFRSRGYNQKHMLVVGCGRLAEKYVRSIEENPQYGCRCLGYLGDSSNAAIGAWLGGYEDLETILNSFEPDEVIIAVEQYEMKLIDSLIYTCEETGIRTSIIPIYNDFLPPSATIDVVGGVRLINVRANQQDVYVNRFVKRVFDIAFSGIILLLISPILLAVAIGVRLSGPGPIFFKQERVGRDRKNFTMYKFRSMRVNAESDTAWSRNRDPRVTRFGAIIRKFSLDELPQFFNVLKGDMSVVGPRPELPHFVEQYKYEIPRYMVKHQVKPGITGWAQVNGYRGDTSLERRIDYDIWYIENWSIGLDIKIILMTVFGGMMNEEKNIGRAKKKEKEKV